MTPRPSSIKPAAYPSPISRRDGLTSFTLTKWAAAAGVVVVYLGGWYLSGRWLLASGSAWALALLAILGQSLLVYVIENLLAIYSQKETTAMRAAFFIALAIGAASLWGLRLSHPSAVSMGELWAVLIGSCIGAAGMTAVRTGFSEDNFPPSADLQAEVLRYHLDVVAAGPAGLTAKRLFDATVALLGLLLSSPLLVGIGLVIWLEDPGPVLFVKNSTARGGKNFRQLKFRTMIREAERETGPVMAEEHDQRVLWIGRFLRKTALDELPQLFNILKGEMSFVGPRPQRTVLVRDYLQRVPGYAERHKVAPGLAGLAQVMGSYYISQEEKLAWDRIYISRMSLGFDLRIIALAFAIVFWFRWQKDWDETQTRRWLNISTPPEIEKS